mmetsp:Transcript_40238/g.64471  ORF Transcript_40238/g.64471 Transcript_40238/m.64471 type:complete len:293 (-) Transcript_40238:92-970(-)
MLISMYMFIRSRLDSHRKLSCFSMAVQAMSIIRIISVNRLYRMNLIKIAIRFELVTVAMGVRRYHDHRCITIGFHMLLLTQFLLRRHRISRFRMHRSWIHLDGSRQNHIVEFALTLHLISSVLLRTELTKYHKHRKHDEQQRAGTHCHFDGVLRLRHEINTSHHHRFCRFCNTDFITGSRRTYRSRLHRHRYRRLWRWYLHRTFTKLFHHAIVFKIHRTARHKQRLCSHRQSIVLHADIPREQIILLLLHHLVVIHNKPLTVHGNLENRRVSDIHLQLLVHAHRPRDILHDR